MTNQQIIHVVLAVYDPSGTYSRHAGVVMASIFANTARPVCVHVLHDDTLSDENRTALTRTASGFGQEVRFIELGGTIGGLSRDVDAMTGHFSRGSLFRLMIPDVMELERVIYLDCDIIVNMPIEELWEFPLDGKSIAAARDVMSRHCEPSRHMTPPKPFIMMLREMNLDVDDYFNSGVLLMDLPKIRAQYAVMKAGAAFFRRFDKVSYGPDQDFLNQLFLADVAFLPSRFNKFSFQSEAEPELSGNIWHLTVNKPWENPSPWPTDMLYWQYFERSAWGPQIIEAMHQMAMCVTKSKFYHRHSEACIKKILRQLRDNIFAPKYTSVISMWYRILMSRRTQ